MIPVVNRGTVPTDSGTAAGSASASRPSTARIAFVAGTRVRIPAHGVDAPVVTVSTHGGVMDIPRDPAVLGWWRGGAVPGSGRGSVVVVGHVDYAGVEGALSILPAVSPGERVQIERPGTTTLTYRITGVRTYPKSSGLPAALFAATGAERLVLITCGGPFDASSGNYEDNIVAFATPSA